MSANWPAWAVERVEIHDPDPAWPALADRMIDALTPVLRPWLAASIEHVGSTAVAGLPAKPVIDLLAPVATLEAADDAAPLLCAPNGWTGPHHVDEGWSLVPPELDGRPWRRLFVLPSGARRVAHLHIADAAAPAVTEILAFRDRLRADPDIAQRYATLKREAATANPDDREAYTRAKSAFVSEALRPRPD